MTKINWGNYTKDLSDPFISTCCGKEIHIEEAILNHGMCDACMDNGLEEANKRQGHNE